MAPRRDLASQPGSPTRRRRVDPGILLVASIVLFLAAYVVHGPYHATADTFDYGSMALQMAGADRQAADRAALEFAMVRSGSLAPTAPAESYIARIWAGERQSERYRAIFHTRPLYPAMAAPLVPFLGLRALIVATAASGVAFGVALGWVALGLTGSLGISLAALAFAFLGPLGPYVTSLMPEAPMLALWSMALGLVTLAPRRIALFTVVAVALAATRGPTVGVLAVALVPLALFRPGLRPHATVAIAAFGLYVAITAALGLPGWIDSMQVLWTAQRSLPDLSDPVRHWWWLVVNRLPVVAGAHIPHIVLGLLALLPLARRAPAFLLGGLAIWLVVLVTPVASNIPRYVAPIWISLTVSAAIVVRRVTTSPPGWERLVRRVDARPGSRQPA